MRTKFKQLFAGMFVTVLAATSLMASPAKIRVISHGATVSLTNNAPNGYITLVDFYADWCGPCRMISPYLESLAARDSQIVLRKVNIVDWRSAVSQQYQINTIPQVWVFNKRGKLVGRAVGVDIPTVNALVARAR